MGRTYILGLLSFALALGGCSAAPSEEETRGQADAVIGGVPESGYTSVGFLLDMKANGEVFCGATLIAPDVALTAAHCVEPGDPEHYVMGLGSVANDPPQPENVRRRVVEVFRHPGFDPTAQGSPFDIAVLHLEAPITDREPAAMGTAETTCEHRYVGYGRSTPSGMFALHTTWGERKSAQTCVRSQTESELVVRGVDGGNCWGDSGGPLMVEGKNELVAVMSRFQPGSPMTWYECEERNTMIMIRVDAHKEFILSHAPALARD